MSVATISEYSAAINTPQMIKAEILKGGSPVLKNGRQIKYSGGFCVVFPFETQTKKYAVRCWHINLEDIRERIRVISEAIQCCNLPYFVGFEYIDNGIQTAHGAQDIVVMDWVDALPLKKYISVNITNSTKLLDLANQFKKMVGNFHVHHIAHGDLQHGNIMVKDNGAVVLVDYDSMYVPSLSGYSDDIKGVPGYQHPSRWKNNVVTEKIDYFSEIIIYTSLLTLSKFPYLWAKLNLDNTETLLFSAEDISSKGTSGIFQILDKDPDLKPLSSKIKHFLHQDDIDCLEPLEKAIIDPKEELIAELAEEWKDNGYSKKVQTLDDYKNTVNEISKLW